MWIYYALTSAFLGAILTIYSKKLLTKNHPMSYVLLSIGFSLPYLAFFTLTNSKNISVTPLFFWFILGSSLLDFCAFYMSAKAIKVSQLSLVIPMASFTPVFSTFFAWIFLSEDMKLLKLLGICIIVIGSYILNIHSIKDGLFEPFKKLFSDKGVRLFLGATFIWGITPLFQKSAIFQTTPQSPLIVSLANFSFMTLFYAIYCKAKHVPVKKDFTSSKYLYIVLGLLIAINQWAALTAFAITKIGYAQAVMKTSVLLTIVFSAVIYKERNTKERFIGALTMLVGLLLLI